MANKNTNRHPVKSIVALAIASIAGILWYWPIFIGIILLLAWLDQYLFAILLGLLLDLLYGPPPQYNALHHAIIPFTLLACLAVLLRNIAKKFLYSRP